MSNKIKRKRWYFAPIVKILTFVLLPPLWGLIVLDDPDSNAGVKVFGVIVLIAPILLICLVCSGNAG